MQLTHTDEERLVAESADHFFAARAPVAYFRTRRDAPDPAALDRVLWRDMGDGGFAGVLLAESDGGSRLGHVAAGLIAEVMGRTLATAPFVSTAVLAATAIDRLGSAPQREHWLRGIAEGRSILAVAVDERPRHAPDEIACRARCVPDGYELVGTKRFVLDAEAADAFLVSARLDDGFAGLLRIERTDPGLEVVATPIVDTRGCAELHLRGVRVPAERLLGGRGLGVTDLDRILDAGRAVLAAEATGVAAECLARALDYLRSREQFGVKLATFQALRHRVAHLHCQIEVTRSAVLRALRALDDGEPETALYVSVAKAKAAATVRLAADEAVQMHGGIAMTDEFDVGFYFKRARVLAETLGDATYHGARVAALLGF